MDPNLSQQIQDKLSYFLDLIEGELVRQISTRSSAFFESLTTLQDLHDEVLNTCHKIEFLRKHLKHFDEDNVKKSLQVPVLQQRRKNYINLHKKVFLKPKKSSFFLQYFSFYEAQINFYCQTSPTYNSNITC